MRRYLLPLSIASLIFAAWVTLSCGSNSSRPLQSITLTPTSADAQNYPNGQVPFVAAGHYNSSPTTVTPLQANWAALSELTASGMLTYGPVTNEVSVDSIGTAHCAAGASGTYAVVAWDLQDSKVKYMCSSITDFGEPGCNAVQAIAQLTCP